MENSTAARSRRPGAIADVDATRRIEMVTMNQQYAKSRRGLRHQQRGGPAACGQYSASIARPSDSFIFANTASTSAAVRLPSAMSGCHDNPRTRKPSPRTGAESRLGRHRRRGRRRMTARADWTGSARGSRHTRSGRRVPRATDRPGVRRARCPLAQSLRTHPAPRARADTGTASSAPRPRDRVCGEASSSTSSSFP